MRHMLLAGRGITASDFSAANSSLLGTVPYGLEFEREAAYEPATDTKMTFSIFVKYSTLPTTKYVLGRVESESGQNYVEVAIAKNERVSITIGEVGRAVATFYSRINGLQNDNAWHNVTVAIDTRQAQTERRAIAFIDGVESTMSVVNPPAYGASLGGVSASYRINLLGTDAAATQLNGSAAHAYMIFGQALTPGYFILTLGGTVRARTFAGSEGAGDIYCPLAADFVDDWNDAEFTLLE